MLKKSKSCANFVAEVAQKIGKVALKLCAILYIFECKILLWYFGKFWQRSTEQHPSILYRPNEVLKLDTFGNKVFVHDNDSLYCKLRCNVISLATLAQWHREWKKYRSMKLQFSDKQLQISGRKDYGCSKVQFAPKFPQNGRLSSPKQPKISQSCAKVVLHGKNCAVAQKRENCANVALHSIAVFWGGTNWCMECMVFFLFAIIVAFSLVVVVVVVVLMPA